MTAQYPQTDRLAALLAPAMEEAGISHIQAHINPDEDDTHDGRLDDSIEFKLPDGTDANFYIQSGPYGIGVNELLFRPDGEIYGTKPHRTFGVTKLGDAVSEIVTRLAAAHPQPASPAP